MTNTDREKIKEALEAVVALKVYLSCQPITCVWRKAYSAHGGRNPRYTAIYGATYDNV